MPMRRLFRQMEIFINPGHCVVSFSHMRFVKAGEEFIELFLKSSTELASLKYIKVQNCPKAW